MAKRTASPRAGSKQAGAKKGSTKKVAAKAKSPQRDSGKAAWPFHEHPNLGIITLKRILSGASIVRMAVHSPSGEWQILDGEQVEQKDAAIVGLSEIVEHDPSLVQLASLPRGWEAFREQPGTPWFVRPSDPNQS